MDLSDFIGDEVIPDSDYTMRWRIQTDRPFRRRVANESQESVSRKKLTHGPDTRENWADSAILHSNLVRQPSQSSENVQRKKSRRVETEPHKMDLSDTDLPAGWNRNTTQ